MQGIHARSQAILDQLLAQLPDWLWEPLAALPVQLADAGPASDAPCCKASHAVLADAGFAFASGMVEALARGWHARLQPGDGAGRPGTGAAARELQLLDLEEAEEEALLEAIARRLAGRASLPLLLLGQRFGVLLARPPLPPAALPLGPQALCAALASAASRLGLCSHARIALYQRFDVEALALYPRLAEAADAALDQAGILRGMSYVPLRRHGHVALQIAQATEQDALQAVGRAAEALAPEARLPAAARRGRRDAMSAMARYLMRHGRDSPQWSECIEVSESLLDAALAQAPAPMEAQAWLRKALGDVGYAEEEARTLAAGLAPEAGTLLDEAASDAGAHAADAPARGVREQRCYERLRQLPAGGTLGFSAGRGGFLHAQVEGHHDSPPRLLLTCLETRAEIIFEADLLARMLASGEAWVVRRMVADAAAP